MKILIITNLYPPFKLGGYEIGCLNIVSGLITLGHEVIVLTTPSHIPTNSEEHNVRRYLELNCFQPNETPLYIKKAENIKAMVSNYTNTSILLDTLKEFKPDCVYCFNLVGIGGLALLDALNTLNYPWVIHLMDRVPENLQAGIPSSILSIFNAAKGAIYSQGNIISMSKHLINEIEEMCHFSFTQPINLVPGWANPPYNLIDREYLTGGIVKFVTAGTVSAHKGIDLIIDAVKLLQSFDITNFSVEIYGEGQLGYYIDLCKQRGIFNKISFLGARSQTELMEIYKSADVFLFPTWEREPFGFAPVEAASVGCVPIITDICGVSERLVGKVHCIKIKRNSFALFESMKMICNKEINLSEMGYNAQMITHEDLSFEYCLKQIEDILFKAGQSKLKQLPSWKDTNLAYLKHNLATKFSFSL